MAEKSFHVLQELVLEIWNEGREEDDFIEDYEFREFLNGYGPDDHERVTFIEQEGGGEGGAEYCYAVIKVDDVFYKVEYSYASYDGYNWDYATASEVKPVERMVVFYE